MIALKLRMGSSQSLFGIFCFTDVQEKKKYYSILFLLIFLRFFRLFLPLFSVESAQFGSQIISVESVDFSGVHKGKISNILSLCFP